VFYRSILIVITEGERNKLISKKPSLYCITLTRRSGDPRRSRQSSSGSWEGCHQLGRRLKQFGINRNEASVWSYLSGCQFVCAVVPRCPRPGVTEA
jgi:hypothetical protein